MTYNRHLGLPPWAEDVLLDSLAGENPALWTKELMEGDRVEKDAGARS
jgi:hypothetical protein